MISARELAERVRGGASAEQVCLSSLRAIEQQAGLGAFIHVASEAAVQAARAVDRKRDAGGELGALAGVPIAIKDLLATRDAPTTCASRMLTRDGTPATGWRPPYDASVIERLRAADAVLIGKTNLDEFAMGSSNENSGFFAARNPWSPGELSAASLSAAELSAADQSAAGLSAAGLSAAHPPADPQHAARAPGGSSGGSAACVAAGLSTLALGTDTGGSIRQPAAFCGVVGLKPSYGRVSRFGLVAFASSLDVIGPIARDVADAARLYDVIAGPDPKDSTASALPPAPCEPGLSTANASLQGLRVGLPAEYFQAGLDPRVEAAVREAAARLGGAGAELVSVALPHTQFGIATYYLIATAEASSNLSRFDGVRFGLRVEAPGADLERLYRESRGQGFGAEVKRRVMLGTYALSAGYYDAYYKKAQQVRALIVQDFAQVFAQVDVLLTPTTPTPAFKLGEKTADPLTMYLGDVYTLPASLAGLPAISLPCGFTQASATEPSLPIGVQLIGPAYTEPRLLQVASALESLLSDLNQPTCPALTQAQRAHQQIPSALSTWSQETKSPGSASSSGVA